MLIAPPATPLRYNTNKGAKPTNPAFAYFFHNDVAGGTTVVDRFGNSGALTLNGVLGTAWTARRGWITPSTLNATSATSYGLEVMPVLTPGTAFCVGFRWYWQTTKTSTTEIVLQLGRAAASTYASVQFGLSASGILNCLTRGVGASASTGNTFGSSSLYVADHVFTGLFHVAVLSTGIDVVGYLDGVQVGALNSYTWASNGGATPTAGAFSDGLTLLSNRQGASSYSQYVGASSGGTSVSGVYGVRLAAPDYNYAQALAIECNNYPNFIGDILRRA